MESVGILGIDIFNPYPESLWTYSGAKFQLSHSGEEADTFINITSECKSFLGFLWHYLSALCAIPYSIEIIMSFY